MYIYMPPYILLRGIQLYIYIYYVLGLLPPYYCRIDPDRDLGPHDGPDPDPDGDADPIQEQALRHLPVCPFRICSLRFTA